MIIDDNWELRNLGLYKNRKKMKKVNIFEKICKKYAFLCKYLAYLLIIW